VQVLKMIIRHLNAGNNNMGIPNVNSYDSVPAARGAVSGAVIKRLWSLPSRNKLRQFICLLRSVSTFDRSQSQQVKLS
jgi:hypothetical protein